MNTSGCECIRLSDVRAGDAVLAEIIDTNGIIEIISVRDVNRIRQITYKTVLGKTKIDSFGYLDYTLLRVKTPELDFNFVAAKGLQDTDTVYWRGQIRSFGAFKNKRLVNLVGIPPKLWHLTPKIPAEPTQSSFVF